MLTDFLNTLEKYRVQPNPDDPYEDRLTHCYLVVNWKGKDHSWEVRGWVLKEDTLEVHAVNYTMAAGYCTINLTEELLKRDGWIIKKSLLN